MLCKICKKEYQNYLGLCSHINQTHKINSKEYYDKYLKRENEGICLECGKETKFCSIEKGYAKFCSCKCTSSSKETQRKKKETCLKNFGVDNPSKSQEIKDKKKQSYIKNYEVENPSKSQEIKDKIKETCLKNFGVDNPSKSQEIKEKKIETCLKNFNVEHPYQNQEVREKGEKSCLKKFGSKNVFKIQEVKNKIQQTKLKKFFPKVLQLCNKLNVELIDTYTIGNHEIRVRCNKCTTEFYTYYYYLQSNYGKCPICFPRGSGEQKEVIQYIENLYHNNISKEDNTILENNRQIISKELDIYIPSLRIAIEYNGLYWHDDIHINKYYHLNKTLECEKQGIRLIHIFSDEWNLKQDIVKSRLKQILNKSDSQKLMARKCEIKEIDSKTKDELLDKFHIQGKDNSKVRIGAFYNDELVSVMTFSHASISKGMKNKNNSVWELNRFCTNSNYHISGIAGKLLSYFKRNYEWKEIFSYADRRWSCGELYYKLGFELDHITSPNYWYVKGDKRIHRFNLRKRPDEPKDISESILRLQEGYSKVWDCGNLKFIMKNK